MAKTIPSWRARQGHRGYQVLLVLLGALILAALAWGAMEFYGETIDQRAVRKER